MRLNVPQLEHLAALRVADALHEYDRKTRREWQWQPHLAGPIIRSSILFGLERRKLARWFPAVSHDLPSYQGGRMKITNAGKNFLVDTMGRD
jgi:hypothetical protein